MKGETKFGGALRRAEWIQRTTDRIPRPTNLRVNDPLVTRSNIAFTVVSAAVTLIIVGAAWLAS